jgi:hypothetical protein
MPSQNKKSKIEIAATMARIEKRTIVIERAVVRMSWSLLLTSSIRSFKRMVGKACLFTTKSTLDLCENSMRIEDRSD